jgi:MYXO-CTERM domain-containing protein
MQFLRVMSAGILALALPAACGEPEEASTGQVERAVVPAGAVPVNTMPGPQSINEDTPLLFGIPMATAFTVTDADSPVISTHVVVTHGTFSVGTCATANSVDGSGTLSVTITGSPASITDCLNSGKFQPAADFAGTAQLTLNSSDFDGNIDVDSMTITVNGVNDPPVNVVPNGTQGATEDVPRTFSTIAVQDVDVVGQSMIVTLSASNGSRITLSTVSGLSFSQGDGTDDASMSFTGLLTDINSALNGMTVTPALNFIGTTQLSITANDQGSSGSGEVGIDTDTIDISWSAVNDAPVNTVPATVSTAEETPFTFSGTAGSNRITVSDVDATVSLLQVTLTVTGGTISLGAPGSVTYTVGDGTADTTMTFAGTLTNLNNALNNTVFTPNVDFVGAATLQIKTDDQGNTGAGGAQQDNDTITINVAAVNDAPVNSVPAAQMIPEDSFLVLSGNNNNLISVADVDAPSLQVTLSVTNGTLSLAGGNGLSFTVGDGSADTTMTFQGTTGAINGALDGLRFDPNPNFNGTATISVLTSDLGATGSGGTKTASSTVAVTVSSVNDTPNAVADSFTISEDSVASNHNLLANDTTVDTGEVLTIIAVTNPANGVATIVGNQVSYQPNPDFNGTDTFSYTISDPGGLTSAATVTVTVIGVNDPPTATADSFTFSQNSNNNVATVLANDSSAPDSGETLTITAVTAPLHGSATISGGTTIKYTPTTTFVGDDSFTYTISDGNGGTASAVVDINVTAENVAPQAVNDNLSVNEDASGVVNVLANDMQGNAPVTVAVVGPASHGTAVVPAGATTVTYTPTANYNGPDSFMYKITDADGETSTATVNITVVAQDDIPQANGDTITTDEDTAIIVPVLDNDTNLVDGQPVVTITMFPVAGTGTATVVDNVVTFTPAPDYNGMATFQYQVEDADHDTSKASVLVTIRPVNDAPRAVNDTFATNQDMNLEAPVLMNDVDPDVGDTLTVTSVTPLDAKGVATVNADGKTIHYVPMTGFTGTDSFSYTVSDAAGLTSNAILLVSVGLDSDGDGLLDTEEDRAGTDPSDPDSDDDGLKDGIEVNVTKTDPLDADDDEDGLLDPSEDKNADGHLDPGETDPKKQDTDGDGLQDGTELGLDAPELVEGATPDSPPSTDDTFIADVDPTTTTDPRNADTDGGGVKDGDEDLNHNGRVDVHETDPNNANDDPKPPDGDFDGVPDATDNCPMTWNQDQADSDADGVGDECELPSDDGCGCRVGGATDAGGPGVPAGGALLVLGVAFVVRARRKRR